MQFTATCVAAILAFTSSAAAAPAAEAQNALKDWQVSVVDVFTPSGMPGSYPWLSITSNVTDPNSYNLGSGVVVPAGSQGLNCKAEWFAGESPLGRTWPCDGASDGYWTLTVLPGTAGFTTGNFALKFIHRIDLLSSGSEFSAQYEATGNFSIGSNLSGVCGGSGVCEWSLNAPVSVKPKED